MEEEQAGVPRDGHHAKMNRAIYRDILNENLVQSAPDFRLCQRFTFQQDIDPKCTAKAVKKDVIKMKGSE